MLGIHSLLYIFGLSYSPKEKRPEGLGQRRGHLFLSINRGNSRIVRESVRNMNRCPIQLKNCMAAVAVELQKNIIWQLAYD
jgi:hypothetical protein